MLIAVHCSTLVCGPAIVLTRRDIRPGLIRSNPFLRTPAPTSSRTKLVPNDVIGHWTAGRSRPAKA